MLRKIKYAGFIILSLVQACSSQTNDLQTEDAFEHSEIDLLKSLNRDSQNSISMKELIQDYFYEPEEIIQNLNLKGVEILYEGRMNQLRRISEVNTFQQSTVYFQEEILKSNHFDWILDTIQCESTVLIEYPSESAEGLSDFCCCFVDNKIYSLFPLWSEYGLTWTREFQLVDGVYGPLTK